MSGTIPVLSTGPGGAVLSTGPGGAILSTGPTVGPTPPTPSPAIRKQPWDALGAIYLACPGIVITRDMISAVLLAFQAADYQPLTSAAVSALVLPLVPEGDPPQYVNGPPPAFPLDQPGATPLFPPALPPQPIATAPALGAVDLATTVPVFAKGLPRFQDSNPEPLYGWSIDNPGWYSGGG